MRPINVALLSALAVERAAVRPTLARARYAPGGRGSRRSVQGVPVDGLAAASNIDPSGLYMTTILLSSICIPARREQISGSLGSHALGSQHNREEHMQASSGP